ncbi:aromatic-ring-hydroxylating dioxygenase subunit beta [Granulicoccus phenolivorans]|uniref:aromatic-ring-hydroxylating dioxygenase subunit beta n=1 Tax=Granulicoccus phenolivorans TaxID=266854 RepID=UPI00040E1A47|nr:aromatic-ring-hydroxylating dioxygenase subunit beta [Granulicoccus phenolivorans]
MTLSFPEGDPVPVEDHPIPARDLRDYEQFIYREARYADEHDYDAWEALWTDDALYWVPVAVSHQSPRTKVSVMYDNRNRIRTRLTQLRTGKRYAQAPASNLRRVVSNIEIEGTVESESGHVDTVLGANFILFESKEGRNEIWGGRVTYQVRDVHGELKLVRKTVNLANQAEALPNMGFLI